MVLHRDQHMQLHPLLQLYVGREKFYPLATEAHTYVAL